MTVEKNLTEDLYVLADAFCAEASIAARHRRALVDISDRQVRCPRPQGELVRDLHRLGQDVRADMALHAAAAQSFAPTEFLDEERAATKSHARLAAGVDNILRRHF